MSETIWDVDIKATDSQLKEIGIYDNSRKLLLNGETYLGSFDKFENGTREVFKFKDERLPELLWVDKEMVRISIVRDNLMNQEGYTGYCGQTPEFQGDRICPDRWPRTIFNWKLKQFVCPACDWTSGFKDDFIKRYIAKWNITGDSKFKPCWWS